MRKQIAFISPSLNNFFFLFRVASDMWNPGFLKPSRLEGFGTYSLENSQKKFMKWTTGGVTHRQSQPIWQYCYSSCSKDGGTVRYINHQYNWEPTKEKPHYVKLGVVKSISYTILMFTSLARIISQRLGHRLYTNRNCKAGYENINFKITHRLQSVSSPC